MPRKKAAAAAAAGAQDTVDSLRTQLTEQREHYEAQSAQALKLLEQKDAELAALRDSTATPVSPGTDASQAASQEAERLRRDAEAKKKEAEILQRARSESAAELARLKTEVSVSKANDAAREAASVACRAAVDELKRLRGTAATDKAALASTAKALDELSKTEKELRVQLTQSKTELTQAQSRLKASQHNSDATQAETERADKAEDALRSAKAANEKLTKRLSSLERSDAATTQREANAAEAIEKARALQEKAQAQMREAASLQQAAKRDGAAELARALDARDLRRRLSLAEADRDAALRDAEDLRTALKTQEPPAAPSMPPVATFTKSTDDGGTVAELASQLTEAHEQLDLCRSSLDALKGSDEDIRARCCSLTQRLHEEAGERNRLERLRARCRCSQQDGSKDMNEDITRRALAAALAAQAAKDSLFAEQQATANKALAAARCRATVAERARDLADARASDASEALQEALSLHGIDRSALADRLPEKEDTTLGATARALDEAERRINAEQERSAILEKRLVEMTSQKADAVEALERETASMRAQADRAAAAELASVAVQAASRSGAGLRSSPRWRSYVDDVLSSCTTERDAKAALLESRAGLARLEARLETSERRADSLQYRLARRGVEEDEEEEWHVKTPKDPELSSLRREALQLADEAQQAREAQKRAESEVREVSNALSALRLEKSALEARCAASEAAQAEATKSSLDLRARAAQAEARAVHRVTSTDDDAKALAQAVLARMDRIQNMATTDDSSEALQTLEKRASELEAALTNTQQRLNDESTARAHAERRAGRESSSRADMEVEVARLKEDLRSLKSAKNLEVLAEAARLEARAEDADKRADLACEDAQQAREKLAEAEKNLGRLEGAGVLAEEARKRADAASQRAKAAEDRCRLAVESAQQKASLAEKRASDAERDLRDERQRSNDAMKREEALRIQSRKDLNDVRNDAKRQRKVFQDFRKEKDELQKRYDKQHSELLEAKSRQATLKLRVGALQTASQSKSPRREVVEKDRLRAEEDAQRKRTDEAARRRLRDIRQQKDEMAHEKRILEEKMSTIIAREEKAEHRRGEAVVRERAAHRKLTVAQDAFEREKTVLTRKLDEAKAMLGRKSADYDQARAARLRTARRADALGNAIKDVGVRLARGLDRARDRAAQLASTSSTPTAGLVAASLLDLAPAEVDQLIASLDGPVQTVRSPRHANAESAFAATIASALDATDYTKIRESIVAVVDERVEHERNLGMALGSRDDAPVQSRRPVVQADDCSVDAVDTAGVLEALGLSTEVC